MANSSSVNVGDVFTVKHEEIASITKKVVLEDYQDGVIRFGEYDERKDIWYDYLSSVDEHTREVRNDVAEFDKNNEMLVESVEREVDKHPKAK